MHQRGGDAATKIEDNVASVTEPILDRRAEQPQRPHIEDQMQPATVQEHHRDERDKVAGNVIGVAIRQKIREARRNEGKLADELAQIQRVERLLEQEHGTVRCDQHPGNNGGIARRNSSFDRNHARFLSCRSTLIVDRSSRIK
jgi:hypothetical protein